MRFLAILNRDGGTLRTTDIGALKDRMHALLEAEGHSVEITVVSGREIVAALNEAANREEAEAVLVAGGDGTVSAAAGKLMNTGKVLAILPAGTMNLFARGLGIPLTFEEALTAFADGQIRNVDIATANGRPFIHQFSIGLHARLVQLRSRLEFRSRLGKIWASVRVMFSAMSNPPVMEVELVLGGTELVAKTTGVGISNNLFGEGHLPYADRPDAGALGVYISSAASRLEIFRLFVNIALGRWKTSEFVEVHESRSAVLRVRKPRRRQRCVIDGELCTVERETRIEIHPGALRVLAPKMPA